MKMTLMLFLLFFITSCSSLSRQDCDAIDWQARGQADGSQGLQLERSRQHLESACKKHDVQMDQNLYQTGFKSGLISYCKVSKFYFLGEMGFHSNLDACDEQLRPQLKKSYDEGRKLYALQTRGQELKKEIAEFKNDNSFSADVRRVSSALNDKSPTEAKEQELREVNTQIAKLIESAPDHVEYCNYETERKKVMQNVMPGFLVSTVPGLRAELENCSRISK